MAQSVYIETTVVSYLAAWRSKDVVRQGQQEITCLWWASRRTDFSLYTSEIVLIEAAAGDPAAARDRMDVLLPIPKLDIPEIAVDLGEALLADAALPVVAARDSQHVGICAANGMDYLLTWNCRHLANAALRDRIEEVCESFGCRLRRFAPPNSCWEQAMDDSLIEEARRAGQAYIDSFKGDRNAMLADLKRRSQQAGHTTVRLPPKPPRVHPIQK